MQSFAMAAWCFVHILCCSTGEVRKQLSDLFHYILKLSEHFKISYSIWVTSFKQSLHVLLFLVSTQHIHASKMKWACTLQPCDLPALQGINGICELCNLHFAPNTLSQSPIAVLCLRFDIMSVGRRLDSYLTATGSKSNRYTVLKMLASSNI